MSLDATIWAWRSRQKQKKGGALKPLKKLVLLSLADRAGEDHVCYPSIARLVEDTEMDRKTVLKIIEELIEDGLIVDTGERKGRTKQVKVYHLIGVKGRETVPTKVLFEDENNVLNSSTVGTVPTVEQFQQFHERVPTIPLKSPNNGTRNLSKNLSIESKNKNTWLCLNKLRDELAQADPDCKPEEIIKATWFNRELSAFEKFNADKNLCDELLIYHFADSLLRNKAKYDKSQKTEKTKSTHISPNKLSEKQIGLFAQRLSKHPEFSSKFAEPGEGYEQLAARIAVKLSDPVQAKAWESYLKQVGLDTPLGAAA